MGNILEINDLSVNFHTNRGNVQALQKVSLSVRPGEVLAVVGESGCGKSTLCRAILGLLPPNASSAGQICIDGVETSGCRERTMRAVRGKVCSMIFQDPLRALNPSMTIGVQIGEAIRLNHPKMTKAAVKSRIIELLTLVGIREGELRMKQYPHQFSGGMRQRVVLAIALAGEPKLLLADEPTTALDVTMQAQILALLKKIQKELGMAIVFISHDMGVVAQIADRIAVMREGRIAERGNTKEMLHHLWQLSREDAFAGSSYENDGQVLLDVQNLTCKYKMNSVQTLTAVQNVSFGIHEGEIFGLVGESGCGKTTIARCVMNLLAPAAGNVSPQSLTRQMIFQDSASSLNPKMKVADIVAEPFVVGRIKPKRGSLRAEAAFQLKYVGLDEHFLDKYPGELSGGQRQRVAIARAVATEPKLLVADEPLSSLDRDSQMQIVRLFRHLRQEHGFSFLFIAHDLAMVEFLCDRVGVMHQGKLVEVASAKELFAHPKHAYTKQLLAARPIIQV